jgi:hypothetical protein
MFQVPVRSTVDVGFSHVDPPLARAVVDQMSVQVGCGREALETRRTGVHRNTVGVVGLRGVIAVDVLVRGLREGVRRGTFMLICTYVPYFLARLYTVFDEALQKPT